MKNDHVLTIVDYALSGSIEPTDKMDERTLGIGAVEP